MNASKFGTECLRLARLGLEIARLPVAGLHFYKRINPEKIKATHDDFTRLHPRYKVCRNKSLGMALLDLREFDCAADYLDSVKQKDYAGSHAKRAKARGYTLREIDRNNFVDDIHRINTSIEMRQGRPMDDAYLARKETYPEIENLSSYGVLNNAGELVAYCTVGMYGNFSATEQLLGYKNNDGTMYLLVLEIICALIAERKVDYLMYDTFLGAKSGLQNFKQRLGFKPYRVRYSIT